MRAASSNHFIDYTLYEIVLSSIRELVQLSEQDKTEILHQSKSGKIIAHKHKRKKIAALKNAVVSWTRLIEKFYEDYVQGL